MNQYYDIETISVYEISNRMGYQYKRQIRKFDNFGYA